MSAFRRSLQKAQTAIERPDLIRKERIERRRGGRKETPLTEREKDTQTQHAVDRLEDARETGRIGRMLGRHKLLRSVAPDTTATEQIWATVASTFIFWTVIPFYMLQVVMWMVGFAGIASETVPLVDAFPGTELFVLCYMVIALIGIGSMVYAAFVYNMRGVRCFAGVRTLVFVISLAGYLVFFLNLFPWIIFWMLSVILAKVDTEEED